MDDQFELRGEFAVDPIVSTRTGKPLSARTLAARKSERDRLGLMHRRHGHGPEGQACRGCRFLKRYTPGGKSFLKCVQYRVSRSEATDWRARWPACGAFQARRSE